MGSHAIGERDGEEREKWGRKRERERDRGILVKGELLGVCITVCMPVCLPVRDCNYKINTIFRGFCLRCLAVLSAATISEMI